MTEAQAQPASPAPWLQIAARPGPHSRAEIAQVTYQASQLASQVRERVQYALAQLFYDRKGPGGALRIPLVRQTVAFPPKYIVLHLDTTSILPFKLERLMAQDTLDKLTLSSQRRVRALDRLLPWREGEPALKGLFLVVDMLGDDATTVSGDRLPSCAMLDVSTRPAGECMVPVGIAANGLLWVSLKEFGHGLMVGESGSGKSTWLHAALAGLLTGATPEQLEIALISPKRAEFAAWQGARHVWKGHNVAGDVKQAGALLRDLLHEFDRRDELFSRVLVRDLDGYNAVATERLPRLVLIADEVIDLALQAGPRSQMMDDLASLVSKARSHGIHIWIAGQHPKFDVLPRTVTANLDTRVCFRVVDADAARLAKCPGAEALPKHVPGRAIARLGGKLMHIQGFYLSDDDLKAVAARIAGRSSASALNQEALAPGEAALVIYAVERLEGAFIKNKLAAAFKGEWKDHEIKSLAAKWESWGWLTTPQSRADPRRVTPRLAELARESIAHSPVAHAVARAVEPKAT